MAGKLVFCEEQGTCTDEIERLNTFRSSFSCLKIREIVDNQVDTSDYYVEGVVTTAYASFETRKTTTKKLVIRECTSCGSDGEDVGAADTISLFLKGEYVNKCNALKPNDIVVVKGFRLEKSAMAGHPFQIVANFVHPDLTLWVIPHKERTEPDFSVATNAGANLGKEPSKSERSRIEMATAENLYGEEIDCYSSGEAKKNRSSVVARPSEPKRGTSEQDNTSVRVLTTSGKRLRLTATAVGRPCYTMLANLNEKSSANVYGVVKFFKSSYKAKGGDYTSLLILVDQSFLSLDESFVCNIFAKSKEQLPTVNSVGDVLRLDNVILGKYNGNIQGNITSSHSFSWLTFDGHPNAPITPVASYPSNYILEEQDKTTVKDLKAWASSHPTISPKHMMKTISQIQPNNLFINLSCQVVSTCEGAIPNCLMMLTVWDGTFPNCHSLNVEAVKLNNQVTDDVLQHESANMTVDVYLYYDVHTAGETRHVKPGDYIKLTNVHTTKNYSTSNKNPQQSAGMPSVKLTIHEGIINGRGAHKLSDDSVLVKQVKETIRVSTAERRNRVIAKDAGKTNTRANPLNDPTTTRTLQTSCTISANPSVSFTSIEKVKTCPKVPNKFRCRTKAMVFLPGEVKDFVQMCCHSCMKILPVDDVSHGVMPENGLSTGKDDQSLGAESITGVTTARQGSDSTDCIGSPKRTYSFSLLLEDESGILHAMVFDRDAVDFFPDLPAPEEFLSSRNSQQSIQQSLVSMTKNPTNEIRVAIDSSADTRPWMECCVMSYYKQGGIEDDSGQVMYRIFGTMFVSGD